MKLINSKERPSLGAVHQHGDIWLVPDAARLEAGATELEGTDARDATPERYDLPPDHPLYGLRALRAVPAGSGDIVVRDTGELEPATIEAEPVVIEVG